MVTLLLNKKNNQYSIHLPKELVKYKGWKKGEQLEFVENYKEVVLRKKSRTF